MYRRIHDILYRGEHREQVERLENHADIAAQHLHIGLFIDLLPFEPQLAPGRRFQQIQATQESTLPAPGRADNGTHFSVLDLHIDISQYFDLAERFLQMFDFINDFFI